MVPRGKRTTTELISKTVRDRREGGSGRTGMRDGNTLAVERSVNFGKAVAKMKVNSVLVSGSVDKISFSCSDDP